MIKRHTDFQDMMNVSIETEDKWLNSKLNSHICYGKGGGGGGGDKQQDVPPTLRPYVTDVLNRAKALYGSEMAYQPYQGERVVPFTAEELAAQEGITGMVGRGLSQDPFLSSASSYYAPAYGLLGEAGALQSGAAREITADEIMGRMSPYQQAVTDITKRAAIKEGQLYGQQLAGQAATTGGFGGSRQAILEAQAASDLGGRLADIQAKGQQEAYMNALQMAEQQRAREMGAGQALSGLSGMYGNLGQQALGQAYRELGYLSGVGEAQRGMGQQRADLAYQEFVTQRDYPDTQLQKYSSLIQGFPFQFGQQYNPPSSMQQFTSGALALGGLGKGLGFFKQGGQTNSGLSGVVYRKVGDSIDPAVAAERKKIQDLIKRKQQLENFDKNTTGYNLKTKQELERINNELQSITDTVPSAQQFLQQNPAKKNFRTNKPIGNMTDAQRAAQVRQNQITEAAAAASQNTSNAKGKQTVSEQPSTVAAQPSSVEDLAAALQSQYGGGNAKSGYVQDLLKQIREAQVPFNKEEALESAQADKRYSQAMMLLKAAEGVSKADPRAGIIPAIIEGATQGGTEVKGIVEAEKAIKEIPKLEAQAKLTNLLTEIQAASALKDFDPKIDAPDIERVTQLTLEAEGRDAAAVQGQLEELRRKDPSIPSLPQIGLNVQQRVKEMGITDEATAKQVYSTLLSKTLNDILNKKVIVQNDTNSNKQPAPDAIGAVLGTPNKG